MAVSFEFFPPRTPEAEEPFGRALRRLAPLDASFFSLTYGANGSTREGVIQTLRRMHRETGVAPAAHLTCVGACRGEVDDIARHFWDAGIRHIVALRGDPPRGMERYTAHPQGYGNAAELVAGLKRIADFEISVAAYPAVHPDSPSRQADLGNLKRKIDAGAARAITQFCFDIPTILRFADLVRAHGITAPLVAGILPMANFGQVSRFALRCGASVPPWLAELFAGLDDQPEIRRMVAATVAADQCRALQSAGWHDFHFYTLNQAELSYAICHVLSGRPLEVAA